MKQPATLVYLSNPFLLIYGYDSKSTTFNVCFFKYFNLYS